MRRGNTATSATHWGAADRQVTLPNGITLTYGQIVALSGEFYRSPEALVNANPDELRAILGRIKVEADEAHSSPTGAPTHDQVNENNADYELATTGPNTRNRPSPDSGPEHVEKAEGVAPPPADASFLDLAAQNAAYFAPDNIKNNCKPVHQLALDKAREAWQPRHPTETPAALDQGTLPSAREGTAALNCAPPTEAGTPPTATDQAPA
jgi:hypothetical protein